MPTMDIQEFKSAFRGKVLELADAGYDDARRIWNASIDKHPRLLARCSGVADVIAALNFARANELLTAIRGGGHNVGGRALCDDGIVIDLSGMRSVYVDSTKRTVRVEGGPHWATWTAKPTFSVLPFPVALSPRRASEV